MRLHCIVVAISVLVTLRAEAGGRRHSIYSADSRLLAETAVSVALQAPIEQEYVWFGEMPVAQFDGALGEVRWTMADHHATPLLQTSAASTVVWRAEHEPFGTLWLEQNGTGLRQPLRFPGQVADATSGERVYNVHRWYRPHWGRYTQADPIGLAGGANLFAYALDNPISWTDPDGLKVRMCCRPLIAGGHHCFFQFSDSNNNKPLGYHGPQDPWNYIRGVFGAKTGSVVENHVLDRDEATDDTCGDWAEDRCLGPDTCVRREGAAYPSPSRYGGMLTGPNSNTFAFYVARRCGIDTVDDVWAPGKNADPPGR